MPIAVGMKRIGDIDIQIVRLAITSDTIDISNIECPISIIIH